MLNQPIPLTPTEVRVLIRCPLHYHFLQQRPTVGQDRHQAALDRLVRETIHQLHAAGGPQRMSLESCLQQALFQPVAQRMIENYYERLVQEWAQMMVSNEFMQLRISLSGLPLTLQATLDRLDRTRDGGILAILFRTEEGALPDADRLRRDPAMTIYHALVAATYPLKRPVRLQELWLRPNEAVTIELSEEEYRHNLRQLREPVLGLARGEVMARPGLHCDVCPFKHRGCPVYAHEVEEPDEDSNDLPPPASDDKMPPRQWIFKI